MNQAKVTQAADDMGNRDKREIKKIIFEYFEFIETEWDRFRNEAQNKPAIALTATRAVASAVGATNNSYGNLTVMGTLTNLSAWTSPEALPFWLPK